MPNHISEASLVQVAYKNSTAVAFSQSLMT